MPPWMGLCITSFPEQIGMDELWGTVASVSWRSSFAPGADWPPPPNESNGYLCVRCDGDLTHQRTAICDAVIAARIMNATLVLPELHSFFRHDSSGFRAIYDVEHFIKSLRYDVRIVESLPEILTHGKMKKMKAYEIDPPPNAPMNWYATVAMEKMKELGAIYITDHRLEEEINNDEYQQLRCRVNYHALRFKPQLMRLSNMIVSKLRSHGPFLALHLRFEMDLIFECYDIFTPEEQAVLLEDRYFLPKVLKRLSPSEMRALGRCPLTPEEVGLILRAMGFDSSTRIYLTAGKYFGGERYMKPLRALFPHLENYSTMIPANEELTENNTGGFLGSAVDYSVCLQADIFIPTYDGPSYFADNVMGHRGYRGFGTTIQPDRKALAPIFLDREKKKGNAATAAGFEEAVRQVMFNTSNGFEELVRRVHYDELLRQEFGTSEDYE